MNKRQEIINEMEAAAKFEHPYRLIRFTLECGHFKLSEASLNAGGIGFSTNCSICSETRTNTVTRQVVNMEETGEVGRFICLES